MRLALLTACATVLVLGSTYTSAAAQWRTGVDQPGEYVSMLARFQQPLYWMGIGITANSDVGSYGDTTAVRLDGHWEVAYYRDLLLGDMDLNLELQSVIFTDSTRIHLPYQLVVFAVDIGWTQR